MKQPRILLERAAITSAGMPCKLQLLREDAAPRYTIRAVWDTHTREEFIELSNCLYFNDVEMLENYYTMVNSWSYNSYRDLI